ncbi:hypothetical protein CORC01_05232 [Colletotrichum orchidophilum]|uniref:C2H2-type domain-containing protein n=1 Tax=Colletotrichum orchidophilum TaxID=1209926 RepID=A0A1G4BDM2_9PEZI|nr:uncharacterized protein CORC01_05232 [Colletotrichum orchidophilum]OHE99432.1 hypothetical protein CORC01_05232 [Colletotrichum orchidophilum]
MSTSWKPQYRQTPPCQQRRDEYLGMSSDIFGLVAGFSVALFLAAMFIFPTYYVEKREQRHCEGKRQASRPRAGERDALGEACRWGSESHRVLCHACSTGPPRPWERQSTNVCGGGCRETGCGCKATRSSDSGIHSPAYALDDAGGQRDRCSSDAISFDITIGGLGNASTRITHSQGYPKTKSEMEAAETLINGFATLLNQSLKSNTPRVGEVSPSTPSFPSPKRKHERPTLVQPRCDCGSSSKSPKHGRSTSEPVEFDPAAEEPPRKPGLHHGTSNAPSKTLSCPFYQRDPDGRFRNESCAESGFLDMKEVKQHIYRHHALPVYCSRCATVFRAEGDLHDHLLEPTRCDLTSSLPPAGYTRKQEHDIRKQRQGNEEQQWHAVYGVLFPNDPGHMVPSPYFDHVPSQVDRQEEKEPANNVQQQQQHFRLQLPRVLERRFVENPTNSESETPIADPTTRNRRGQDDVTVDVVRGAQTELYRNFRPIRQQSIDDFAPLSPGLDDDAVQVQTDDSKDRQHSHDSSDLGVLTESSRSGSIQSNGFVCGSDEFSFSEAEDRGTFFQISGADRS